MSSTTTSLHAAIVAVQKELPVLPKDAKNPHFKSRYTPLDTIVKHVLPILGKHGLSWVTLPGFTADLKPTLEYALTHAETGEAVEGEMLLMLSKEDAQAQGSALTYARRYALSAVLGIVSDEDVDGNDLQPETAKPLPTAKPKTVKKLSVDQVAALTRKLAEYAVDDTRLKMELVLLGVDTLSDLTTTQANALVQKVST